MTNIGYIAHNNSDGFSNASFGYINSLRSIKDISVLLFYVDVNKRKLIREITGVDKVIIHSTVNNIKWIIKEIPESVEIIANTIWETDKLPLEFVHTLNNKRINSIIVPTLWNKKIFIRSGVKTKITVIPHTFDIKRYSSVGRINILSMFLHHKKKSFYTIGQWSGRKNIQQTITSYLKAFKEDDGYGLVIKTFGRNYSITEKEILVNEINEFIPSFRKDILVLTGEYSCGQINYIHKECDIFVSTTHSEGWGLGAFEAALFGNEVIITGFGGHLQFIKDNLIDYRLGGIKNSDYKYFTNSMRWAYPISKDIIDKMKNSVIQSKERKKELEDRSINMFEYYDPKNQVNKYKKILK